VACSGKASRKGLRRWASAGATRGGQERQREASDGAARWPAAALVRGRGDRGRRRKGGGAPGADLQFQKLQGSHCNAKFPTILKLK
jgi:hypothetical protein